MNLRTLFTALIMSMVISCEAQEVINLYNGTVPGNLSVKNQESFSRPETGRPSVINVTNPTITVFIPQKQNAAKTAVIICPGGGYLRLTIEDGGYDVARSLAASGITAFVLKYRTWQDSAFSNYRDIPMQDLQQAMKIIKENAGKWNIDINHFGILGFSAGGHLAAMGSTGWATPTGWLTPAKQQLPAFTILAYPVISFTDSLTSPKLKSRNALLGQNINNADKEAYSPELHVTATTPPAFIVHAEDDSTSLVGNSIAYYKALRDKKVPAQLLLYQKGGHGFAMYNKMQDEYWLPAAIKWLALNGFYKSEPVVVAVQKVPAFWNDILALKKIDSIQPPAANSILLTGSSSFTRWKDVNDYFPGYPIVNRAFGGSTLPDVIRYAYDVILPYKPKQVLIYCGDNDLAASDSITAADVVNRVKTLFAIIRQNLPNTTISYVSIKPSPSREKIQDKVKQANKDIKAFFKTQKNADFIDVYDAMLDSNRKMREELYVQDRLHMKPEGYAIWKKIIGPYLRKS